MQVRIDNARLQAALARMEGKESIAAELESDARRLQVIVDNQEMQSDSRSWR